MSETSAQKQIFFETFDLCGRKDEVRSLPLFIRPLSTKKQKLNIYIFLDHRLSLSSSSLNYFVIILKTKN